MFVLQLAKTLIIVVLSDNTNKSSFGPELPIDSTLESTVLNLLLQIVHLVFVNHLSNGYACFRKCLMCHLFITQSV